MHKQNFLSDLCKRLAQLSQEIDDTGNLNIADKIDAILEDVSTEAKQPIEPEQPAIAPTSEKEAPLNKEAAKLSKRQKASLRGFYRAASRMLDTISIGKREFPDKKVRRAMTNIVSSMDDGLDLLEEFGGVVSQQDKIERHAAKDADVKTTTTDSELRLYSALKTKMTKDEIISVGILTTAEVDDLEVYSQVGNVCPDCGNDLINGKCPECESYDMKPVIDPTKAFGTSTAENTEPVQRSMDY